MDRNAVPQTPPAQREPSASLQIEFSSGDPQLRASFRQAIVAWLTGVDGGLGRTLGLPEGLEVDESAGGAGTGTTRVSARWWRRLTASRPVAVAPAAEDRIVFRAEARDPLYRELPPVLPAFDLERPACPGAVGAATLPAAAAARIRAAAHWSAAGSGALFRSAARASSYPIVTLRLPSWQLRPAAVIMAVLTVATAGLTVAATQQHAAGAAAVPGAAAAVAATAGITLPTLGGPTVSAASALASARPGGSDRRETSATVPAAVPAVAAATGGRSRPAVVPVAVTPAEVAPPPVSATTDAPPAPARAVRGPLTGSLVVTSTPAGAQVSVNGVARGRTPVVIRNVPAGSRVVRLDLEGYRRWSWAVTVAGQARTPVSVKLQPDSAAAVRPALFER